MKTITEVLEWALAQKGTKAVDHNYYGEWCAQFVNEALGNIFPTDIKASCTRQVDYAKRQGWQTHSKANGSVGDILYYEGLDSIVGDYDHVGIIVEVYDNYYVTVEGNTSGVNWRSTKVNTFTVSKDSNVIGAIITPPYTVSPAYVKPSTKHASGVYSIKDVSTFYPRVQEIQHMLNVVINAGLTEDGYFGKLTSTAVTCYQQQRRLEIDGVVGRETLSNLVFDYFKI
ncbi:MAG: peptidoglycan-binding protein [Paludibacteraceae bacterium]|nr:peptidoglycan-binding protein [Paludibacteraceae bacterium]